MKNYFRMISVYLVSTAFLASCTALTDDLSEITNGIPPDTGDRTVYGNQIASESIGLDHGDDSGTPPDTQSSIIADNEGIPNDNNLNGSSKSDTGSRDHGDDDGIPPDNALSTSSDQESNNEYWDRDMHDINGIPPDNLIRTNSGYFGRAHGDSDGIPPDGEIRTNWGNYPAGGLFDENQDSATNDSSGN